MGGRRISQASLGYWVWLGSIYRHVYVHERMYVMKLDVGPTGKRKGSTLQERLKEEMIRSERTRYAWINPKLYDEY